MPPNLPYKPYATREGGRANDVISQRRHHQLAYHWAACCPPAGQGERPICSATEGIRGPPHRPPGSDRAARSDRSCWMQTVMAAILHQPPLLDR